MKDDELTNCTRRTMVAGAAMAAAGFCALLWQVAAIRELLVDFEGNELVLGLLLGAMIVHNHIRPVPGQHHCRSCADTPRSTGHQSHLALQINSFIVHEYRGVHII